MNDPKCFNKCDLSARADSPRKLGYNDRVNDTESAERARCAGMDAILRGGTGMDTVRKSAWPAPIVAPRFSVFIRLPFFRSVNQVDADGPTLVVECAQLRRG
jgi:hypothetical protein